HVDNGTTDSLNLIKLFSGFYDTTTGPKKDSASYQKISQAYHLPAESILFLSDVVAELDAAASAGMKTGLLCRPENPPVPDNIPHPRFTSLDEVIIA
ncbi:MAG TPA: HAD-IA family hydrolase, partial [Gemmatales bacterium]|nr:HAD-IA family hydrolase [Gemmatales bacterium]